MIISLKNINCQKISRCTYNVIGDKVSNIDNFKAFVKENPSFADYIKDGSMTWQKFYELYDMYGTDDAIWNSYRKQTKKDLKTFMDIINMAKNIDMNKLQDGVDSLSKAVGLFSDLFLNKNTSKTDTYKPRAIYRKFED